MNQDPQDLFQAEAAERRQRQSPLANRMRPQTLNDYVGQEHIIGPGRLLRRSIEADQLSSLILYGPPGTGKTTLASVIANTSSSAFVTLNAVLAGVKVLREEIEAAGHRFAYQRQRTTLFVDEVHRWNKAQQDALLPHVENGAIIFIGATTENPFFEVIKPLVSRSRVGSVPTVPRSWGQHPGQFGNVPEAGDPTSPVKIALDWQSGASRHRTYAVDL